MNRTLRVLHVEDLVEDAVLLERELRRAGYDVISRRIDNPDSMDDALAHQTWNLISADCKMRQFSAVAALEQLKESEVATPLIVVSGTICEHLALSAVKAAHRFSQQGLTST